MTDLRTPEQKGPHGDYRDDYEQYRPDWQASVTSNQRLTPEQLAEYREIVPLGIACGVGGAALAALLDEIERLTRERDDAELRFQNEVSLSERLNNQLAALSGEPGSAHETGEKPEFASTKRMLAEIIADLETVATNNPMSAGTRSKLRGLIAESARLLSGAADRAAEKASPKPRHDYSRDPCPCKGHPFNCFDHPHDCGCTGPSQNGKGD